MLGCCGLRGERYGADKAELGIELAPQYWGCYRYAIEVASDLLEFGFGELGLQEVRGFSISANARVTRLAHRYGFVAISSRPGSDWMQARGWSQTEGSSRGNGGSVYQPSNNCVAADGRDPLVLSSRIFATAERNR